jgi:hypothetical protein
MRLVARSTAPIRERSDKCEGPDVHHARRHVNHALQQFPKSMTKGVAELGNVKRAVSLIILATLITLPSNELEAQANRNYDTSVDPSTVTYTLKKFESRILGVVIPPKFATDAGVIAVARRLDQDIADQIIDGIEIYDDPGAVAITDDGEWNKQSSDFNKKHTLGVYRRNVRANINELNLYDSKGTGKVIKGSVRQEIRFAKGEPIDAHAMETERERRAQATPDPTLDHWRTFGGEPKWEYYEEPDQMGRGVKKGAHVDSLSTLSFQFPYEAPQLMRLVLQKSPKNGNVAYFKIERGQFVFAGYDEAAITVRFDNGKPQSFSIVESSDGSRNIAIINNYTRFVRQLRKAKGMDVEVQFYLQGSHVVSFDVHGLSGDW